MNTPTWLAAAASLVGVMVLVGVWMTGFSSSDPPRPPVDLSLTEEDVRIEFWYGPTQTFGWIGQPQRWINVLGNIQPAPQVESATFSINEGEEQPISLGSDLHRLALPGDFNAELSWDGVRSGENSLDITVTLRNGEVATDRMTLAVAKGNRWPLPYHIDFSQIDDLQDVVQIVDGHWRLEPDGVRTVQRYYDRVLTMGDTTWTDYEATVRLTVHGFAPPEPSPPTYNVTHFGVALRW